MDSLGTYIRTARTKRGIKARDLARQLGISNSYLSDIEYDRRRPAPHLLEKIADALGLPRDDLMARAGYVGPEAEEYLRTNPAAVLLVRTIVRHRLTTPEVAYLFTEIERIVQERGGYEHHPLASQTCTCQQGRRSLFLP
jgi:transcriptional regulator with XRE-family HTH domain